MSLSHLPAPWRPNAIYQIGARVTIRDEHNVYVLRCESPGRVGLRPPKLPHTIILRHTESLHATAIVKVYDGECEWWLERAIRKTCSG
jgi:hypothetical protein